MSDDVTYTRNTKTAAWIPENTVIETEQQAGGEHRQVVAVRNPDDGTPLDVDVTASALPTGAATSAKQDVQITAEQAIQALLNGTGGLKFVDEAGALYGVKHIDNKPRVVTTPYGYQLVDGGISGHSVLYKFGSNPDVGIAQETIWTEGGLYDWAGVDAAAGIVKVSSTSLQDAAGGTGALTCTIYGLSTAGAEQNEAITLTGQTAVNSTLQYSRVNRIICNTAGTNGANVGKIYVGTGAVASGVPAVKWAVVEANQNQTLMSLWTVPAGKTLYVTSALVSTNGNKGSQISFYVRPSGGLFLIKTRIYTFSNPVYLNFENPFVVPAGSDIDCRGTATATGAAFGVTFSGWYE